MPPKLFKRIVGSSARARAMALAAAQSRALEAASRAMIDEANKLRRRQLLRRAFRRWKVVKGQSVRLPMLRRNYIVNLARYRAARRF